MDPLKVFEPRMRNLAESVMIDLEYHGVLNDIMESQDIKMHPTEEGTILTVSDPAMFTRLTNKLVDNPRYRVIKRGAKADESSQRTQQSLESDSGQPNV